MFDPKDFYNLAMQLASKKPYSEASGRTGISRAYYSALLQVREKVKQSKPQLLFQMEPQDTHWKVREAIKEMSYPNISGKLYTLSRLRGKADYDLWPIKEDCVKEALLLSQNILRLVEDV